MSKVLHKYYKNFKESLYINPIIQNYLIQGLTKFTGINSCIINYAEWLLPWPNHEDCLVLSTFAISEQSDQPEPRKGMEPIFLVFFA